MTCDFKLTDGRSGKEMSVNTHKLVTVLRPSFQAMVGSTGLAHLGIRSAAEWVADAAESLPEDAGLNDLLNVLRAASLELGQVPPGSRRFRRLTFVLGAIQGSQSVIALVSNFQSFKGELTPVSQIPPAQMTIDVVRPSKPTLRVAGEIDAVRKEDRKAAETMLRSSLEGGEIRKRLASLNRRAARRRTTISEGCFAASQYATGNGESEPHLVEQTGDFVPLEVQRMLDKAGIRFKRNVLADGTDAPIRVRGLTSGHFENSPSFFREQFKLRPGDSDLWNNYGTYELSRGRIESARRAYEKALELNTENHFAARNLGNLLWRNLNDSTRGEQYIRSALNIPDANHRRDFLSLLAENLAVRNGEIDRAESIYSAAMEGDPLTVVETRYASFLVDYYPGRVGEAERILESALGREPNYGRAIIAKAHCDRIRGLPDESILPAIVATTERFPRDVDLALFAAFLMVATGDCKSARRYLNKIQRAQNLTQELKLAQRGIVELCEGDRLDKVTATLTRAGDVCSLINVATIRWATDRGDRLEAIVSELPVSTQPIFVRVEHCLIRGLVSRESDQDIITSALNAFGQIGLHVFDPTVMVLLSRHPEISAPRRDRLTALVAAVRHASSPPD